MSKRVAIIYLSYHCDSYLDRAISAFKEINYPKESVEIVAVDAPHPEYGRSLKILQEKLLPLSEKELPHVTIIPLEKNFGFAGNNNVGIKWALEREFDYALLHNQDGFTDKDCLIKLVETMENDKKIGAAQSLILLYPETNLINSAGNAYHFLGFGYCDSYRQPISSLSSRASVATRDLRPSASETEIPPPKGSLWDFDVGMTNDVNEIAYASGASLLLRADLLRQFGLLDEDLISYHEDLEYSLRLKSLGYKIALAPEAKFFHEYSFVRNSNKYYLMERNRFAILLMYYNWLSLLLILPMAILVEVGLLLFASMSGWLKEKIDAYRYWINAENIRLWLNKRKIIQNQRTVSDSELLSLATSVIIFNEEKIHNPILKYIANPIMEIYWWIAKFFII